MSSTRHAPERTAIAYEKYMSSPDYAEMRGIPGTAVAAKAQLYDEARKRSLLFFLQSLSLKHGGLRKVACDLIEGFPKRVGDRNREEELAHLLVEFCINPQCIVRFSDDKTSSSPEVADALRDFQDQYEVEVRSGFVLTTIGKEVFETLDHALAIGKMVVVEGESGSGKTTAAEAWCAQHQGEARFISLSARRLPRRRGALSIKVRPVSLA